MKQYFNLRSKWLMIVACLLVSLLGICALPLSQNVVRAQAKSAAKGSFKVGASPLRRDKKLKTNMTAEDRQVLQEIANEMNQVFILPQNIYLSINDCGEANAFYNPEAKEIVMCTELVADFEQAFSKKTKDEKKVADAVEDATMFVFFHELGHALIDIYDLPITGKEEDAVDQLSTFIIADGTKEGAASVINGALAFVNEQEDLKNAPVWDEHSLGIQRFYNIICLLYGQDPNLNKQLVERKALPRERAERCPGEYARMEKAWSTLLSPHIKD